MTPDISPATGDLTPQQRPRTCRPGARWLLLIPYLALLFPQLYARNIPVLFGLSFFYWYQLAWVLLAAALLGLVYRLTRD